MHQMLSEHVVGSLGERRPRAEVLPEPLVRAVVARRAARAPPRGTRAGSRPRRARRRRAWRGRRTGPAGASASPSRRSRRSTCPRCRGASRVGERAVARVHERHDLVAEVGVVAAGRRASRGTGCRRATSSSRRRRRGTAAPRPAANSSSTSSGTVGRNGARLRHMSSWPVIPWISVDRRVAPRPARRRSRAARRPRAGARAGRRAGSRAAPRSSITCSSRRPSMANLYTVCMAEIGTMRVKSGLAEMLKGGVIMDVVDAEQARIAEDAGACAVMALERVPADIRRDGGVARMADPDKITRDPGGRDDPGDGQVPHRPLRRGADPARRSRSTTSTSREVLTPGRHGAPRRQVGSSPSRSSAAARTSARRCAASPRARR